MRIIQFLRGEPIACALAGAQNLEISKELLAVDSNMIDQALDEIAKLILRLEEHPKKTRKEKNTSRKIQRICVDAYHIKVRWQHSLYILNKCLHQTVQL